MSVFKLNQQKMNDSNHKGGIRHCSSTSSTNYEPKKFDWRRTKKQFIMRVLLATVVLVAHLIICGGNGVVFANAFHNGLFLGNDYYYGNNRLMIKRHLELRAGSSPNDQNEEVDPYKDKGPSNQQEGSGMFARLLKAKEAAERGDDPSTVSRPPPPELSAAAAAAAATTTPPPPPYYPPPPQALDAQGNPIAGTGAAAAATAQYPPPPPGYYPYYPPPPQQGTTTDGTAQQPQQPPPGYYPYYPPPPPQQVLDANGNPVATGQQQTQPQQYVYNPYYPPPPPPGYAAAYPQQQQQQTPPTSPGAPPLPAPETLLQGKGSGAGGSSSQPLVNPVTGDKMRPPDKIANTADLYLETLKLDTATRARAYQRGDFKEANAVFGDPRIEQLKTSLKPYLESESRKQQQPELSTAQEEMLEPFLEAEKQRWTSGDKSSEEEKSYTGISYKDRLARKKNNKETPPPPPPPPVDKEPLEEVIGGVETTPDNEEKEEEVAPYDTLSSQTPPIPSSMDDEESSNSSNQNMYFASTPTSSTVDPFKPQMFDRYASPSGVGNQLLPMVDHTGREIAASQATPSSRQDVAESFDRASPKGLAKELLPTVGGTSTSSPTSKTPASSSPRPSPSPSTPNPNMQAVSFDRASPRGVGRELLPIVQGYSSSEEAEDDMVSNDNEDDVVSPAPTPASQKIQAESFSRASPSGVSKELLPLVEAKNAEEVVVDPTDPSYFTKVRLRENADKQELLKKQSQATPSYLRSVDPDESAGTYGRLREPPREATSPSEGKVGVVGQAKSIKKTPPPQQPAHLKSVDPDVTAGSTSRLHSTGNAYPNLQRTKAAKEEEESKEDDEPAAAAKQPSLHDLLAAPIVNSEEEEKQSSIPNASSLMVEEDVVSKEEDDPTTRNKLRTMMGLLLKHRGGPGFGAGRLKTPTEQTRLIDTSNEILQRLSEESGGTISSSSTAAEQSAAAPAFSSVPATPSTTQPSSTSTMFQTTQIDRTKSSRLQIPLETELACIAGAMEYYRSNFQSPNALNSLRQALLYASEQCTMELRKTSEGRQLVEQQEGGSVSTPSPPVASTTVVSPATTTTSATPVTPPLTQTKSSTTADAWNTLQQQLSSSSSSSPPKQEVVKRTVDITSLKEKLLKEKLEGRPLPKSERVVIEEEDREENDETNKESSSSKPPVTASITTKAAEEEEATTKNPITANSEVTETSTSKETKKIVTTTKVPDVSTSPAATTTTTTATLSAMTKEKEKEENVNDTSSSTSNTALYKEVYDKLQTLLKTDSSLEVSMLSSSKDETEGVISLLTNVRDQLLKDLESTNASTPTTKTSESTDSSSQTKTVVTTTASTDEDLLKQVFEELKQIQGNGKFGITNDISVDKASAVTERLSNMRRILMTELQEGGMVSSSSSTSTAVTAKEDKVEDDAVATKTTTAVVSKDSSTTNKESTVSSTGSGQSSRYQEMLAAKKKKKQQQQP